MARELIERRSTRSSARPSGWNCRRGRDLTRAAPPFRADVGTDGDRSRLEAEMDRRCRLASRRPTPAVIIYRPRAEGPG